MGNHSSFRFRTSMFLRRLASGLPYLKPRTGLLAGVAVAGLFAQGAAAQSLDPAATYPAGSAVIATPDAGAATDITGMADGTTPATGTVDPQLPVRAAATDGEAVNARAMRLSVYDNNDLPEEDSNLGRDNLRTQPIDGLRPAIRSDNEETPGIGIGTFTLRPALNNSIASETTRSAGTSTTRSYLQTELKGTLTSDWSRHQLTVTGDGIFQRNISGEGQTKPSASVNADLRLDISRDTVAHLTGGYSLTRESATDPNALLDAVDQSRVQTLTGGATIERDFGLLRGLAALDVSRTTYSDATLSDGSTVSLSDRNRNEGNLRLRVGYELSPALIPFLEASAGRTFYDEAADSAGYERNSETLGGKAGVQIDLGEKLKGELGIGYRHVTFADARLAAIDAVVLDAAATWSPRRGTDITLGLITDMEPSVAAGQSGYVSRALTLALTQQLRDDLVAKLSSGATWRDYRPSGTSGNEVVTTLGASMAYGLNRYLDLTADLSWERTQPENGSETDVLRAGLGLTLKR